MESKGAMKRKSDENEQSLSTELKEAIAEKYGTQEVLAKKLGITQGNLSSRLKNPSRKFMKRLEKQGVVITTTNNKNKNVINGHSASTEDGRYEKMLIEMGKMLGRIELLEKEVDKLKERI